MARVLYGVMGNTYGHISRALAIAGRMPEHEFHFIGGGRVPGTLNGAYPVLEVPVARTVYRKQRAAVAATTSHLLRCAAQQSPVRRQILKLIEHWQPDLAICDREFFLPIAARAAGLPCVSVDHSHVLQACRYPVPASEFVSWSLGRIEDIFFFNRTRHNLIVSFFHPPLKASGRSNELLHPIMRQAVRERQPGNGDYVFVYQSTPTFHRLIDVLRGLGRPAIVYGFCSEHITDGSITFKPFDPHAILDDLAGCAYAVVNGGHNLICEALALGKPLLCFPIANNFEQFINCWYVRALGYGDFSTGFRPELATFERFEARLDEFRSNIARKFVDGTEQVLARVREIINTHAAK